jgi:hypothetical protein
MKTDETISPEVIEARLLEAITRAWAVGWQPRELVHQVRRSSDRDVVTLALIAIAADHAPRPPSTLDPRWVAQLEALDLPAVTKSVGWLEQWTLDRARTGRAPLADAHLLQLSVGLLPPIKVLIPPPGGAVDGTEVINLTEKTDDPILNRVRALLAQAESTNFEAEAETFTAKAQELMTRHAIDMAMVAAGTTAQSERPGAIRIPIDAPYVRAKWTLLAEVAESSRCRAVFAKHLELATVVGFDPDLQATETLYTSLLVQAQVALRAATAASTSGGAARTRSFRASFLHAYAYRVGERLDEINGRVATAAEAETGDDILPVLAARTLVVERRVDELFPRLRTMRSRAMVDPEGWASGRMAADRARLNAGDLTRAKRALRAG